MAEDCGETRLFLKRMNKFKGAGVSYVNPIHPMKTLPRILLLLLLGLWSGQAFADEPVAETMIERKPLTPEQIEELVGPIALYPDPLLALILPAATFPSDIVLAARYLGNGGSVESVASEPWDDSVRALARYREVIDYLDTHLAWTRSLGNCFLDQRDDVMDAIQMVRARARTAGLLQDTPQQEVIVEPEEIRIIPAEPTVIYVPRYDPSIVCNSYATVPVIYRSRPFITFGIGWRIGTWLNFDCDWRSRSVRIVHRPSNWYYRPDWRDHDRYRRFSGTDWVRRSTYPGHDRRFDRSPRTASYYDARGADHRHGSNPGRFDGRDRNDNRWDDRRRDDNRGYSGPTHGQMAREIRDQQRRTMDRVQEKLTAPTVVAVNPAARVPSVNPAARISTVNRRSNNDDRSRGERFHRPESPGRDNPVSHRGRSERVATPPPPVRSQQVAQTPPPARRVETQNRPEERRRSDDGDRSNRSGGGRSYARGDLER